MPKLPEFLFTSYKRYKADTNQLTTWLVDTAKGLGYGLETSLSTESPRTGSAGRLKGKARKEAQRSGPSPAATTSHKTVFVKEFPKLARFIAGFSDRIKVPSLILKLARSAISIRKHCAGWFEQRKDSETGKNVAHWHFIAVLEEVVKILDPLCEQHQEDATVQSSPAADQAFVNSFFVLNIEETRDEEELGETIPPPSVQPPTGGGAPVVYSVAEDDKDDWLVVYCLFEDLHNIRAFLRATWTDYRDKKIDLITASVTTNMAFGIIRSTQEDLLALHPKLDDYYITAEVLYDGSCVSIGENVEVVDMRVFEFVFGIIYKMLEKLGEAIMPDVRQIPVYKPGHFGTYNPRQCRDEMSEQRQKMEDFIIMSEVLPDFVCIARGFRGNHPLQDEFTQELQKMVSKKEISLLLVFSVQVYLDIHHVLREQVGRGLHDLKSAGLSISESLQEYARDSPKLKFENWPPSNEMGVKLLESFIQQWIMEDPILPIKYPVQTRLQTGVELEPFFLFNRHPFMCGMLQFRLQLLFQDFGLSLTTAWGTILFVSHLYEACKHEGFLRLDSWKDMEWIMKVHDKERMFRGRVPQTAMESFKSLNLMAGASASSFSSSSSATHKFKPGLRLSSKGPSFLKENSPVSAMFRNNMAKGLTAEMVEDLLSDVGVNTSSLQLFKPTQTNLQRQWARSHKMTHLQFLSTLRAALGAEQHMIRFDYVRLHMRCIKLLREIKATLHDQFVQLHGEGYLENETQLSWLVGWVLYSALVAEAVRLRDGSFSNGMLLRASRIVYGFIQQEGDAECARVEKALHQTSTPSTPF